MKVTRPWVSLPARNQLGAGRGRWWIAISVIVAVIAIIVTVLVLVQAGTLSRAWAYACIPVAIFAAALARVLTLFKAAAEDKQT